jgi:hypothetical protein
VPVVNIKNRAAEMCNGIFLKHFYQLEDTLGWIDLALEMTSQLYFKTVEHVGLCFFSYFLSFSQLFPTSVEHAGCGFYRLYYLIDLFY